jgi:putative spermidine/putrescine transport system permease protein
MPAREPLILLAPGLALLALAFVWPVVAMTGGAFVVATPEGTRLGLDHLARLAADAFYVQVAWRSLRLGLVITLACVVVGFPLAVLIQRAPGWLRGLLLVVLILPLMTSVVIRTFGWLVVLGRGGPVSLALQALGVPAREATLMHTETGIVLAMVQVLLPFMVLAVLGVLARQDPRLEEAARCMGAGLLGTIARVSLPLAAPGIVAGSLLVFALAISSFITPGLVGGVRLPVLAGTIYQQVTGTLDWPFAAAQALALLAGALLVIVPYTALATRPRPG